jgi:ABC-type glycerol-3-phosphate transport system substrate-binding protein
VYKRQGWTGIRKGVIALDGPDTQVFADAIRAVTRTFPNGYTALERNNATFSFVQGKAGMHFTGSWDAGTLAKLSAGKFRIGVITLPLPAPGEPYGDPIKPPANETAYTGGGCYGITKASTVKAEAIDFLQYWTSRKVNERMNAACEWLPSIIGARAGTVIAPYQPQLKGVHPGSGWYPASNNNGAADKLRDVATGQILGIANGEKTWEEMRAKVNAAYADPYMGEPMIWNRLAEGGPDRSRNMQRNLAPHALRLLLKPDPETARSVANLTFLSAGQFNGQIPQAAWREASGGAPFPEKP